MRVILKVQEVSQTGLFGSNATYGGTANFKGFLERELLTVAPRWTPMLRFLSDWLQLTTFIVCGGVTEPRDRPRGPGRQGLYGACENEEAVRARESREPPYGLGPSLNALEIYLTLGANALKKLWKHDEHRERLKAMGYGKEAA